MIGWQVVCPRTAISDARGRDPGRGGLRGDIWLALPATELGKAYRKGGNYGTVERSR